ncbi:MAG: hypothetical protein M3179_08900, partial [Actinomycetota bacterium]|nr:hypothetical protein [Actinomycetota bacterium]
MSSAPIRPSRVWFWVGGLLAILGLAAAGIWIGLAVKDMIDRTDDLQRVSLPGTGRVTFDDPGSYTVYVEAPGADDEDVDLPRGQVFMEPVDGGDPIEFEEYDGTFTYNWGGHEGRAVLTFEIADPGAYRVRTETESGQPEGDVAIGESLIGDLPRHVVLALIVALLALVGAAVIITGTAGRRSRARRALAPPGSPGYRPPPGQYLP